MRAHIVHVIFLAAVGCGSSTHAPAAAGGSPASGSGGQPSAAAGRAGDTASGGRAGAADSGGRAGAGGTSDAGVLVDASMPDPEPTTSCPASEAGNVGTGQDQYVANTGKQAVETITYTNVGATGAYAQVVDGWSKATGCVSDHDGSLCKNSYRKPKSVSGALAPFNEDMTFVFAGPIELYQLAVYRPIGATWTREAYWDRCSSTGLVFAGNKSWYECNGFVESYVTSDGTVESEAPVQFSGSIAAGTEVHVMSDALCTDSSSCGWSSGLPLRGFAGDASGSKLFAVKMRMPLADKTPAYWILPGQVIRSSQYGCNCRGAGSDPTYKGGCGELDVAEILGGVTTSLEATTTLYSFQGITGGGSVTFARPVHESVTFIVFFDAQTRHIGIHRLKASEFAFAATLPETLLQQLRSDTGALRALE